MGTQLLKACGGGVWRKCVCQCVRVWVYVCVSVYVWCVEGLLHLIRANPSLLVAILDHLGLAMSLSSSPCALCLTGSAHRTSLQCLIDGAHRSTRVKLLATNATSRGSRGKALVGLLPKGGAQPEHWATLPHSNHTNRSWPICPCLPLSLGVGQL